METPACPWTWFCWVAAIKAAVFHTLLQPFWRHQVGYCGNRMLEKSGRWSNTEQLFVCACVCVYVDICMYIFSSAGFSIHRHRHTHTYLVSLITHADATPMHASLNEMGHIFSEKNYLDNLSYYTTHKSV